MVRPQPSSARPRRRPYRRAVVILLAVFAALALAACGDDNNDDSDGSDTTAAETTSTTQAGGGGGAAETVNIGETEYKLDPSSATVKAGEVTFDVSNDGTIVHNLEVEGPGEEATTDDLEAGQSGQVTVDLSKPGTYEMYCSIDGHRDLGMEGTVTVTG